MTHHPSCGDVVTSLKREVNGISYAKDFYIVSGGTQNMLQLGCIVMIFQHKASTVCFLVKKCKPAMLVKLDIIR